MWLGENDGAVSLPEQCKHQWVQSLALLVFAITLDNTGSPAITLEETNRVPRIFSFSYSLKKKKIYNS